MSVARRLLISFFPSSFLAGPHLPAFDCSEPCPISTVSSRSQRASPQWASPNLNRRESERCGPRWTSTGGIVSAVSLAGPQPDLNGQKKTEDIPYRMSEDMTDRMPEDMPDRMPEDMTDRMPEDMPDRRADRMSNRMPEDLPDRMPDRMLEDIPDRMSEDMPDRMPEDLPDRQNVRWDELNAMVGITRSKVFFSL